ncbi:hypothetical protein [Sphingomonas sp. M1-B02]|uniref:hypothetical protein n=1 Tax=Sphingomonas sp. M1-B02 TaxID=3114300 RepID=UPI00223FE11A|nr:hypothetical protein [Sphingomonas sp. S6-11]UZK66937.1 hypothetical protein OKW87_03655 [Sphingomonas sp. S6-11]
MPFTLPAASARIEAPAPRIDMIRAGQGAPDSFDMVAPRSADRWNLTPGIEETTSADGGSYAVRDILRAQPRRSRRGSPLAAALVLRLDGQEDSEPFSIGGGGVAAALWRAVPKE